MLHCVRKGAALKSANELDVALDRDVFMRGLIRELASSLESVVGLEEASGYISLVGQSVGSQINEAYTRALEAPRLTREQVADVLVDLKLRIKGDFFVISQDDERIVLGSRSCPFAEKVLGRESMCMMTSNVFGTIAAQNLGYARVELEETIARGSSGCRVVVHLRPDLDVLDEPGREYFGDARTPTADGDAGMAGVPGAAGVAGTSETTGTTGTPGAAGTAGGPGASSAAAHATGDPGATSEPGAPGTTGTGGAAPTTTGG